jgi:hypothetical protein
MVSWDVWKVCLKNTNSDSAELVVLFFLKC